MEVDLKLSLGDEETAKKNDRDSSRSSTHSSLSPDHTDGLGSPEDYCQQVFALCDPEGKGYITRDTLSRFCDRRNSVLDSIMSTLDHDKDGRISYDEFREGFENYSHDFLLAHGAHISDIEHHGEGVGSEEDPLPTTTGPKMSTPLQLPVLPDEDVWESEGVRRREGDEEEGEWGNMSRKIDPDNLLRGTEVGRVWSELADRDPSLLEHFERFLSGVTAELKQSQHDKERLEIHMKRAMDQHNREVMEMEDLLEQHLSEVHEDHQIKSANKTQQLSSRFHALLAARDQVIHQLVDKEDHLKKELQNKSRSEERLLEEKEGLLKANRLLKEQLDRSIRSLSLKRRPKVKASPMLARSATVDHSDSTQDNVETKPETRPEPESPPAHYFPPKKSPQSQTPPTSIPRVLSQELGEAEQDSSSHDHTPLARRKLISGGQEATTGERKGGEGAADFHLDPHTNELEQSGFESRPSSVVMKGSFSATQANTNLHTELFQRDPSPSAPDKSHDTHVTPSDDHETNPEPNNTALSHLTNDILTYSSQVSRTTGDNASQTPWLQSSQNEALRPSSPMAVNRVFKVVFLGNSGVGKTSLIVRVSQGQFAPVHSTLGLDFTTKTLTVGDERVVFQLWDTAGQERFHNALTSVYFRRADAFIIVYDVTSRDTFKSVRNWLSIITASLREHPPVLMLVGNKCDNSEERKVSSEEGRQLALELHAMFSEMSALSGTNVMQSHQTLASLLLARENEELEKARKASLDLSAQPQKRRCFC